MRTDEDIKKTVIDAMYWDDRVDASKIATEVDGGVVTLTGAVPSYRARVAAEEDARVVRGVTGVENLIVVTYPETTTLPSDGEILTEITDRLDRDPDVDATNVVVTVDEGWVTLEGTVPTYWEKEVAESIAGSVLGIVGVTDRLAVAPVDDIADQLVADDIVAALDRNVMVDVNDVDVEVVDGFVTLRGTVPSWNVRNIVVDTVRFTTGVVGVDDRLAVGTTATTR